MSHLSCAHGIWEGACLLCKPIHSGRDQLWNFRYTFKRGRTLDIHSKRQFDRECHQAGLVRVSTDELLDKGLPSHPSRKPIDLAPIQQQLQTVYRESRDPHRVERKWQELAAKGKVKLHGETGSART